MKENSATKRHLDSPAVGYPYTSNGHLHRQTSFPQCFLQQVDGVSVSPYRDAFSATPDISDSAPSEASVEIQPFPTDILSEEILHLILYHVLAEPDFGKNGRWSTRDEANRDKAQFAKAHKVSERSPTFQCTQG